MTRVLLTAAAVASAALWLATPAVAAPAPCDSGLCIYQQLNDEDEDEDEDDEDEDDEDDFGAEGGWGPWANLCSGFDTQIPFIGLGGCTSNLVGP